LKETQTKRSKGFSLIELLIVVAIILIIAAIAIPNLLRARIAANEASAANSIRKIATAEVAYSTAFPTVGYAPALTNLGGPATNCSPSTATACILDSVLSGGTKSGYQFVAIGSTLGGGSTNSIFVAGSAPIAFNQTGVRSFCAITDGVLRSLNGAPGTQPANSQAVCVAYPMAQ
jgi:prepilin-type N-terminal cleavage/methylation domain-containing protein